MNKIILILLIVTNASFGAFSQQKETAEHVGEKIEFRIPKC